MYIAQGDGQIAPNAHAGTHRARKNEREQFHFQAFALALLVRLVAGSFANFSCLP